MKANDMMKANAIIKCRGRMRFTKAVGFVKVASIWLTRSHGGGGLQDWLGHTVPTMQLLPGDMETVSAQLTTPGRAVLKCNVADHITAGDCLPPVRRSDCMHIWCSFEPWHRCIFQLHSPCKSVIYTSHHWLAEWYGPHPALKRSGRPVGRQLGRWLVNDFCTHAPMHGYVAYRKCC